MSEAAALRAPTAAREFQAIGLVTAAHFLSHFYQFVLPPVFGLMALKLDVGYTELGLLITTFSVATGVSQTPAGFLVDRLGAAKLLALGLGVLGAAVALFGFAPTYVTLLPLVAIAGMAMVRFVSASAEAATDNLPTHYIYTSAEECVA